MVLESYPTPRKRRTLHNCSPLADSNSSEKSFYRRHALHEDGSTPSPTKISWLSSPEQLKR